MARPELFPLCLPLLNLTLPHGVNGPCIRRRYARPILAIGYAQFDHFVRICIDVRYISCLVVLTCEEFSSGARTNIHIRSSDCEKRFLQPRLKRQLETLLSHTVCLRLCTEKRRVLPLNLQFFFLVHAQVSLEVYFVLTWNQGLEFNRWRPFDSILLLNDLGNLFRSLVYDITHELDWSHIYKLFLLIIFLLFHLELLLQSV